MKKQLVISALFDTSAFDRSITEMQRKLRDLHAPTNLAGQQGQTASRLNSLGVNVGGPNQAATERANLEYRKNVDNYLKEEYKKNEALVKLIKEKEMGLKRLAEQQKAVVGDAEKELKVKEKIAQAEKEYRRDREEYNRRDEEINRQAEIRERMGNRPSALQQFGGRMAGMGGRLGSVGGAIGAFGATAERFTGYGQRLEEARGNAIEGATGRDLAAVYAGRSPFEALWMQERANAQGLAEQKSSRNRTTDFMKGLGGLGMLVGGAAMTFGSMGTLGVPGTALMAGGAAMLSNDRSRMGILGGQEYQQLLAAEQTKDFWGNLENFKKQDPKKRLAMEHFEQNFMRDLGAQRTLGLGNAGFYGDGGLLARGASAGFTRDMTIDMAQAIVGAGGSARMGQQAPLGLQMQRGGLTNASSLLGTLSGSLQAPEASKSAIITIMAEAFKKGLDTSNYVEETRRFTAAAADIISRTGAVRTEDQGRLADTFGMFMGERTNAGVAGARNAYEEFQQRGSQLGGRRGVMRFSEASRNKNLSRLNPTDLTELLSMRPEELQSDPASLEYFTQAAGYQNSGDLLKDMDKLRKTTRFQVPSVRRQVSEYAETVARFMKDQGMSQAELNQRAREGVGGAGVFGGKGLPADVLRAVGGMRRMMSAEGETLTQQEAIARQGEILMDTGLLPEASLDRSAAAGVLTGGTGRVEDDMVGAIAKSADAVRTNFNELKTVLTKAVDATQQFAESATTSASAQRTSTEARRSGLPSGDPMQGSARATTQGQASSRPFKGSSER